MDVEVQALPGMEGQLNPLDEAQLEADAARRVFEDQETAYPWMDVYWDLRAEGWNWRQAIYIAWLAMPQQYRKPRTQIELATGVLGLASDRRLRQWREDNPAIEERSVQLSRTRFFEAIPGVIEAMIESAQNPNGRNSATDRRTFFGMLGVEDQFAQREAVPEDLSSMPTLDLAKQVEALEARNAAE